VQVMIGQHHSAIERWLRLWLFALAALVAGMVVLGGATRLTQSGLSITEWQPVDGVIPPLSTAGWQAMFEKYQQIPQYKLLNKGMTLDEFKPLFWWEWSHRMLGRFIGLVAATGLIVFLSFGQTRRRYWRPLVGIFALGALEGAVGWYMVASGLQERTEVSQYRLALHLSIATLIIAAALWMGLGVGRSRGGWTALSKLALGLAAAVYLQIILGAFVAGLGAGRAYNTWPLMEGRLIPHGLRLMTPIWLNPFENAVTVQFDHRMWAYAVACLALANHLAAWRSGSERLLASASLVLCLVLAQIGLGIATLLMVVPLHLALTHQLMAMAVLAATLWHLDRTMREFTPTPASA
jgi:heme a synthase